MGFEKLNIGCGTKIAQGWLNIGLFPEDEVPYNTVQENDGALLLNCDVTGGLPSYIDNVRYTYAGHFIEHLTWDQGIGFLSDIYRITRPRGVLRLVFPDLELWVKSYYENDMEFFDTYQTTYLQSQSVRTKGEIFMSQVHGFRHKWCYDFESIEHILRDAGFVDIEKKFALDSSIPDIDKVEPRSPGRLLESAYVECVKGNSER